MASVAELERLTALTQRLIPISQFQRGTLIRADDWNLLIAAVIELARAVLLDTESASVNDHEHADEVDIGWLTPRLRKLMEQGGLSDPVANRRLVTLERNSGKNKSQIDKLLLEIGKLRSNIDNVKVNDIGREGDLTILRRQFEARSDSRDEVLDLRNSLDNIKDNINKTLEIGDLITVDGEVADINNLSERITGLEALRDSLTGADGNVLDASSLEIRLAGLQTKLVSQDQLDEALEQVRVRPPRDLVDRLQVDLNSFVEAELTQRLGTQQTEYDARYINTNELSDELNTRDQSLRDQTNTGIDNLSAQVGNSFVSNDSLDSRLQSLSSTLKNSFEVQVETEIKSRLAGLQTDLDARYISSQQLNTRLAGLSTELDANILANVQKEISRSVQTALQQQGKELFVSQDVYNSGIRTLNKRIDEGRSFNGEDIDVAVTGLQDRFVSNDVFESSLNSQQEQFDATIQDRINAQVAEQVNTVVNVSLEQVSSRLEQLDLLESRINTNTTNQLNNLRQDFTAISRQTTDTGLQGVQNDLRTMQDQVNSINTRLTAGVDETVSRAMTEFKQQVQSDIRLVQQNIAKLDKRLVQIKPVDPLIRDPRRPVVRAAEPEPPLISDFTEIEGIGAVLAKRLIDNNIRSFSDLASMPSDKLASVLKISESRVNGLQIQTKAAAKLQP